MSQLSPIEQAISDSGVNALCDQSRMDDVSAAVKRLATASMQLDQTDRGLLRAQAIDILRACKIKAGARIVDAALFAARSDAEIQQAQATVAASQVEAWPDPVDGRELHADLVAAINAHVVLAEHEAVAVAYWILFSYVIDAFENSPRLAILSPTKRCGKSTLLMLLAILVDEGLTTSNISAAALFRILDARRPTLLIDEADSFLRGNEDIRNVLNAGHSRANSVIIRCVSDGEDFSAVEFDAWGAVVIAAIGELADTLSDRSITVRLRRKGAGDETQKLRRRQRAALIPLARRCVRWSADNLEALRTIEVPELPLSSDRAADNWEPMVALATQIGGATWQAQAIETAKAFEKAATDNDVGAGLGERLLTDIKMLFDESIVGLAVSMKDLAAALSSMDGAPWAECCRGSAMTTNYLGRKLSPFDVKAKSIRLDKVCKGYEREMFDEAFARYLGGAEKNVSVSPPNSGYTVTSAESLENPGNCNRTDPVTDHPATEPVTVTYASVTGKNCNNINDVTEVTDSGEIYQTKNKKGVSL